MWRFPKPWGYPEIIQVMDDHLSIETHGDLGIPHFNAHGVRSAWVKSLDFLLFILANMV